MSKNQDRQLRLKRLTERELSPQQLGQVTGGATRPDPKGRGDSRYCALTGDV